MIMMHSKNQSFTSQSCPILVDAPDSFLLLSLSSHVNDVFVHSDPWPRASMGKLVTLLRSSVGLNERFLVL